MSVNYHAKYDDGKGLFLNQNLLADEMTAENDKMLVDEMTAESDKMLAKQLETENDRLIAKQLELDELRRQKEIKEAGYITKLPHNLQQEIIDDVLKSNQQQFDDSLKVLDNSIAVLQRKVTSMNHEKVTLTGEMEFGARQYRYQSELNDAIRTKAKLLRAHTSLKDALEGHLDKLEVLDQLNKKRMANFSNPIPRSTSSKMFHKLKSLSKGK